MKMNIHWDTKTGKCWKAGMCFDEQNGRILGVVHGMEWDRGMVYTVLLFTDYEAMLCYADNRLVFPYLLGRKLEAAGCGLRALERQFYAVGARPVSFSVQSR